jgi:hypothetical protein
MKLLAVLAGGLMLSQAGFAKESLKKPVSQLGYENVYEAQLEKTNIALLAYSTTDCTSPEFNKTVDGILQETGYLTELIKREPNSLDEGTKLRIAEQSYGVYYILSKFVEQQNQCIDDHHGDKTLKIERGL